MVTYCCVFGCSSSLRTGQTHNFYRFPKVNPRRSKAFQELVATRRKAWFRSVKRKDLKEEQMNNLRICEKHFISGKPAAIEDVDDPDWSPSVNMGYKKLGVSPASKKKRYQRRMYRESFKKRKLEMESQIIPPDAPVSNDVSIDAEVTENLVADTGVALQTDITCSLLTSMERESTDRNQELYALRQKVSLLTFADESSLANKLKCLFFTGLSSVEVVKLLQSKINVALSSIKVGHLNNFQKVLLTLMKLRNNNTYRALAYRFDIRPDLVGVCFKKVVVLLEYAFRYVVHWPDRDGLRTVMPTSFYKLFGNSVAVIIDCFEIKTQRPSNVKAKAQTFSNYKQSYTQKYLIGVTPQGNVSFVSDGYGGRASDKFITEDCGILNNLLPGDIVLADRGFTIHEQVSSHYGELKIPAFLRGEKQLHPEEIETTRKIASVRVHVERVIGNLRNKFKIMNGPIPINLITYKYDDKVIMDYVVRVCCILNNVCESVIPLDEPKKLNENVVVMTSK